MNVELFSCAGGMALGFRAAGIEFDLVIDKNPDACESYRQNLGSRPVEMDVRDLIRMLAMFGPSQAVELLVADPPCTPWSRAGKRRGLDDERDMLRETVDVIQLLRPRCWLIGNVPGLDDAPNWHIVQRVIGGLAPAYCIDYAKLDAADYGVPQHRVRPFWFGRPCGSQPIQWPAPTHGDSRELGHVALGDSRRPWVTCRGALGNTHEPATTVTADPHLAPPGHHEQSFLSVQDLNRPATTVTTRDEIGRPGRRGSDGVSQSKNAIKLSEHAAAILQGFPETAVFFGDTKKARWSQLGQAMPPPLAEAVARSIMRWRRF